MSFRPVKTKKERPRVPFFVLFPPLISSDIIINNHTLKGELAREVVEAPKRLRWRMKRGAEGERARLNGDEASKKELQEHGDWRANIICDDRADVTKVDYAYLVISLKYVAGIMKRGAELSRSKSCADEVTKRFRAPQTSIALAYNLALGAEFMLLRRWFRYAPV